MDYIKHHKWIVLVVALLLVVGIWFGLSSSSGPAAPLLTTSGSAATAAATGVGASVANTDQDLVATLLTLRAVKLEGNIFSDPAFVSLRDFSTQIIPEPVGRPNPFAPLVSQMSTTTTTVRTGAASGASGTRQPPPVR